MGYSEWLHFDFLVIRRETDKAFEVIAADNKIYWLPKKCVADFRDYSAGDRNGTMSIPEWLAVEKGMINEPST